MPVAAVGDAEVAGDVDQAEDATSAAGDAAESPAPPEANPFLAAMPPTRPPADDPRP